MLYSRPPLLLTGGNVSKSKSVKEEFSYRPRNLGPQPGQLKVILRRHIEVLCKDLSAPMDYGEDNKGARRAYPSS